MSKQKMPRASVNIHTLIYEGEKEMSAKGLKGMFMMEVSDRFFNTNAIKFENNLIEWVNNMVPNKVLLFEKSSLTVGKTTKKLGSKFLYKVELPRIRLEYVCINGDACVLTKIIQKGGKTEKIIYEFPDSWAGTAPWYVY